MLSANEDALVCDLAETYGILNYRALPASLLATLAVGLRADSRIKMYIADIKEKPEVLLWAAMLDRLSFLAWAQTKDGQAGKRRPLSVLASILGKGEPKQAVQAFGSPEDFKQAWASITEVKHGNGTGKGLCADHTVCTGHQGRN